MIFERVYETYKVLVGPTKKRKCLGFGVRKRGPLQRLQIKKFRKRKN